MGKEFKAATRRKMILNSIPVRRAAVIGSGVYCGVRKRQGGHVLAEFVLAGSARAAKFAGGERYSNIHQWLSQLQ